jgi:hypothetical protein
LRCPAVIQCEHSYLPRRPMAGSTFQTNPFDLHKLLEDCHNGIVQLPDFQRSWVWDEDRIKSLIASVSRAFPVGALMTLNTGGPVKFKPRPIEGAPLEAKHVRPQSLLLDGQQRMTSLYQVTLRGQKRRRLSAGSISIFGRRWKPPRTAKMQSSAFLKTRSFEPTSAEMLYSTSPLRKRNTKS